jgi:hypothetical protein
MENLAPRWERDPTKPLYLPRDIDEAHDLWGANCGPTALAALLGLDCKNVRLAFNAGGKWPGYTNPSKMEAACRALGANVRWTSPGLEPPASATLPAQGCGLIHVQFTGPWEKWPREAYRHTHWIAFDWRRTLDRYGAPEGDPVLFTFDCNWGPFGAWMPLDLWVQRFEREVLRAGKAFRDLGDACSQARSAWERLTPHLRESLGG